MKWILGAVIFGLALLAAAAGWWYYSANQLPSAPPAYVGEEADVDDTIPDTTEIENSESTNDAPRVEVIAENLQIPWEVLFLPGGELLVTQRSGSLLLLKQGTQIPVPGVAHAGEGGLLGAALHPDFTENQLLYLYQTTETENGLRNRVVRYILAGEELTLDRVIVDDLPGASYHDGGRIVFGTDGYLYVTLGDAGEESAAQDPQQLAGSILRYTVEGEIPADNPFGNAVYSYGHRNPQGLAWDEDGQLWSTEHGRSGVRSGFDELNLITQGENYGWPEYEGDETASDIESPVRHSGADTTWAPASLAYHSGSLYFAGLRGQTLYEAVLQDGEVTNWREHLVGEYGRLRTVVVGPDGLLYITTSNRDGRGRPAENDDRILRVNPAKL